MARHENFVNVDLADGQLFRSFTVFAIGDGDKNGNRLGVDVFNSGSPVTLTSATCVGYFIRSNGDTIVINGSVSGNRVYVTLPQSCYAIEGQFTLAIKLVQGSATTTLRIVDGTVVNTTTDTLVDPGTTIPSLADYTALVTRAEAAAATIDHLSTSATLVAGDRYRCNVTLAS